MGVCDVPVISNICEKVSEGAGAMISAPFEWLANGIAKTAAMLFEGVWVLLDKTTLVNVTSPGYVKVYNVLFGIAVMVMLVFFFLQLITGLVRRDPSALSRAALGLAKSVVGSFVVITLTGTLLELTDQLATAIVHATGTTIEEMGGRIGALAAGLVGLNIAAPGVGAVVTIFLGGLAIVGAALVWFSLLIRKALLLVAIVLAPIALAGATWDATRGWIAKWASFVIALILSKLVVIVVFLVAITQVSSPITFDLAALTEPIAGIALMLIAGFAPYMCYKFISFIGVDLYQLMESERESKQALNRPVPIPRSGGSKRKAAAVLDGKGSGSATSPSAGGATVVTGGETTSSGGMGAGTAATGAGAAGGGGLAGAVAGAASGAGATVAAASRTGQTMGGAAEAQSDAAARSAEANSGGVSSRDESVPTAAPPTPSSGPAESPGPDQTTGAAPPAMSPHAAESGPTHLASHDGVLDDRQEDHA